jgi:hypothetical protein
MSELGKAGDQAGRRLDIRFWGAIPQPHIPLYREYLPDWGMGPACRHGPPRAQARNITKCHATHRHRHGSRHGTQALGVVLAHVRRSRDEAGAAPDCDLPVSAISRQPPHSV